MNTETNQQRVMPVHANHCASIHNVTLNPRKHEHLSVPPQSPDAIRLEAIASNKKLRTSYEGGFSLEATTEGGGHHASSSSSPNWPSRHHQPFNDRASRALEGSPHRRAERRQRPKRMLVRTGQGLGFDLCLDQVDLKGLKGWRATYPIS